MDQTPSAPLVMSERSDSVFNCSGVYAGCSVPAFGLEPDVLCFGGIQTKRDSALSVNFRRSQIVVRCPLLTEC
jgi:hypothetical protein